MRRGSDMSAVMDDVEDEDEFDVKEDDIIYMPNDDGSESSDTIARWSLSMSLQRQYGVSHKNHSGAYEVNSPPPPKSHFTLTQFIHLQNRIS